MNKIIDRIFLYTYLIYGILNLLSSFITIDFLWKYINEYGVSSPSFGYIKGFGFFILLVAIPAYLVISLIIALIIITIIRIFNDKKLPEFSLTTNSFKVLNILAGAGTVFSLILPFIVLKLSEIFIFISNLTTATGIFTK